MIGAILGFIMANGKAALALGFLILLIAIVIGVHVRGYDAGQNDAFIEVIEQNRTAEEVAREGAADVQRCHDLGGQWDVSTGRCS